MSMINIDKIPFRYSIKNGKIFNIKINEQKTIIVINGFAHQKGEIEISFPNEKFDAVDKNGIKDDFIVLLNCKESLFYEEESLNLYVRDLVIPFNPGNFEIEIIA